MLAWAPIVRAIEQRGLAAHGAFALDDDERKGELADVATIALVGLAGRRGWAAFSASPEAQDGAADPLDRWSRRVVDGLAAGSARARSIRSTVRRTGRFSAGRDARSRCTSRRSAC